MLGFLLFALISIRFESRTYGWHNDYSGWARQPRHTMAVIKFRQELHQLLTFPFIDQADWFDAIR